jgi:hypothetical protein
MTNPPCLRPSDEKLITPNGELNVLGRVTCRAFYKSANCTETFYALTSGHCSSNLLSRKTSCKLGVVQFIDDVTVDDSLFGFGVWRTEPVKFHLKPRVDPVRLHSARHVAVPFRSLLRAELDRMEREGVIESVSSPTDWVSAVIPVVTSLKSGKKKVRICVDFRQLNRSLMREPFQIPTFDELSYELSGAHCSSKLDAASGFFQIPICEESRHGCNDRVMMSSSRQWKNIHE